ncbi:hypothetical protein RQP46_008018 [Phenoliferia psychrophenolica]
MAPPGGSDARLVPASYTSDDGSGAPGALPLATFATLPLEIKSLVVTHVCANDRAHQEYRSRAGTSEAELIEAVETPWHGRGLFAVAAVSKELNGVCANYMFESLTTEQACAPIFGRRILSRHARYIRSISLAGTLPNAIKAFNILPALTNLSEIRIDDSTATPLFGMWTTTEHDHEESEEESEDSEDSDAPAAGSAQAVRRVLFRHGTPFVSKIHFNGTSLQQVVGIMGALDNLASVSITWDKAYAGPVGAIIDALAGAPHLRDLTLELPKTMSITPEWNFNRTFTPSLAALTLRGVDPSVETFDFVAAFATTIETLDIDFKKHRNPPIPVPVPIFHHSLPHLNHLRMVNMELSTACLALESLAKPAVPTTSPLRKLDLEVRNPKMEIEKAVVEDNDHSSRVRNRVAKLRHTLEFGLKHVDKLEAARDLVGMETAFRSLEKLRVWQKITEE